MSICNYDNLLICDSVIQWKEPSTIISVTLMSKQNKQGQDAY